MWELRPFAYRYRFFQTENPPKSTFLLDKNKKNPPAPVIQEFAMEHHHGSPHDRSKQ